MMLNSVIRVRGYDEWRAAESTRRVIFLAIAARMIAILEAAAFEHARVDEDEARRPIDAAERLIASVR